jgi:hypothetical protein
VWLPGNIPSDPINARRRGFARPTPLDARAGGFWGGAGASPPNVWAVVPDPSGRGDPPAGRPRRGGKPHQRSILGDWQGIGSVRAGTQVADTPASRNVGCSYRATGTVARIRRPVRRALSRRDGGERRVQRGALAARSSATNGGCSVCLNSISAVRSAARRSKLSAAPASIVRTSAAFSN